MVHFNHGSLHAHRDKLDEYLISFKYKSDMIAICVAWKRHMMVLFSCTWMVTIYSKKIEAKNM